MRIVTEIQGVVLPTWLVIAAFGVFLVCAGALVQLARALDTMEREIRILQLHVRDVESVLIRSGVAQRDDFAPWETVRPPTGEENEE